MICSGRVLTPEQGVRIETGRETTELRTIQDPFEVEDVAFLNDKPLSTYADALETHRLCLAMRI